MNGMTTPASYAPLTGGLRLRFPSIKYSATTSDQCSGLAISFFVPSSFVIFVGAATLPCLSAGGRAHAITLINMVVSYTCRSVAKIHCAIDDSVAI